MEKDFKYFDEIEKYCEDKMDDAEKADFEGRVLVDPDLAEELELYKKIVSGIKHSGKASLKNKLSQLDGELDKTSGFKKEYVKKRQIQYSLIAVPLLFLVVISYFVLHHESNNKIIAKFEEEDAGIPVLMGSSANPKFDKAMSYYKQQEYDSAIITFKQLVVVRPTDTLYYYMGICEYMKQRYIDAEVDFEAVVNTYKSGIIHDKAEYRLGLTYWKEDKIDQARKIFETLTSGGPYSNKAEAILKVLPAS